MSWKNPALWLTHYRDMTGLTYYKLVSSQVWADYCNHWYSLLKGLSLRESRTRQLIFFTKEFYQESKTIILQRGACKTILNPDLLNIRFSTPFSFTAQRRPLNEGDAEQTCHEPWHLTKHSAGCHPYVVLVTPCCRSESYALLSLLYTQGNRLQEDDSLAQGHAGSKHWTKTWILVSDEWPKLLAF